MQQAGLMNVVSMTFESLSLKQGTLAVTCKVFFFAVCLARCAFLNVNGGVLGWYCGTECLGH